MGRATNSAIQANANKPQPVPYDGDVMVHNVIRPSDFKHCCAVVVTGTPANFCGHALLHTGGGLYFHIAGFNNKPKIMTQNGYLRYLKENGKREIRRWVVSIPDPAGAHRKLDELLAKRWLWLMLPQNCASFVEEVVRAGGSKAGQYFNCPSMEPFKP